MRAFDAELNAIDRSRSQPVCCTLAGRTAIGARRAVSACRAFRSVGASVSFRRRPACDSTRQSSYARLHSLPRFATAEKLQRKQELTRLTPKRTLVPAQPVERIGGQVCQADEGSREVGLICGIHAWR